MELTAIVSFLLIAVFLTVLVRQYRPELALGISMVAGVCILLAVIRTVSPSLMTLKSLLAGADLPNEYTAVLFKALGICLLTQFTADICRDAGENALASKAEFIGRILLLMIALPLFESITTLALSLMQE